LILCDWFLPGYMAGGPIQSVAALTHHLRDEFEFSILTTDRDFKSTQPYEGIVADRWTEFAGRKVYYISPSMLNAETIENLINSTPHDLLYINSLYSKFFAVIPLQLRRQKKITAPVVLAPRGMLSEGALKTKTLKKKLFLAYARALGLFKGITWQSTSTQETAEIHNRISRNAFVREASNLPNVPPVAHTIAKQAGELKLCNIARICDTKNVHFAIEVLTHYKGQGQISFDIFGPVEDPAYWEKCRHTAAKLPANVVMRYNGSIPPSEVAGILAAHHALFLPSHNENFGHGIVEALFSARPVLISDQTPWRHLHQKQVGFDLDLDEPGKFLAAIEELLSLDNTAYQTWCKQASAYIHEHLAIDHIRHAYGKLFS